MIDNDVASEGEQTLGIVHRRLARFDFHVVFVSTLIATACFSVVARSKGLRGRNVSAREGRGVGDARNGRGSIGKWLDGFFLARSSRRSLPQQWESGCLR